MNRSLTFFGVFVMLTINLLGQQLQFNSLTVNDGLSQNDVSCVMHDSEGFIWIGTYDGLNRFDGYDIQSFFHDNKIEASLSSNRIKCLLEEDKKRIWIGTDGYGLNYYDLETGRITRVTTPNNYKIINDIKKNKKGDIIVATNHGLLKVVKKGDAFSVEVLQSALTGFKVRCFEILKNGDEVYITDKGIWVSRNDKYELIERSNSINFFAIVETSKGDVWLGGGVGLFQLVNDKLISQRDKLRGRIRSIVKGINNDLWISTFDKGLFHLDLKEGKALKEELENDFSKHVFLDKSNTLWVAGRNGLLYSNLNSKNFRTLSIHRKGLVRTLLATKEKVYYGLRTDRFYTYSFKRKINEPIEIRRDAKPLRVDTLYGKIHLATTKGLYRKRSEDSDEFDLVPIFNGAADNNLLITSFCKDAFGNQFFGSFRGLIIKNKSYTNWVHEQFQNLRTLRNVRVFSLKADYFKKCLWVGTIASGLFKINFDDTGNIISAEHYSEKISGSYHIPNNSIWSFYQEKDGALYIGTGTGLIHKKLDENQFKLVDAQEIQNKKIMGIIKDDSSNLWLTNSQGIIKYSLINGETQKFNHFDGLLTNTFTEAVSKNENGELFFGSIEGINSIKPDEMEYNPFPSKIAFTNLIVNNAKIGVNQNFEGSELLNKRLNRVSDLTFNYKQNDFSIEFTSTNYANVNVNKYRYKLDNYDNNWQIVNNDKRYASYSNLESGNYQLLVEATNPDGQWSNEIRTLNINVEPAPWRTWWAYLLYFLAFSGLLTTFIYFWMNKQKLRNQMQLSQFKSEQEKEINEMKLTFFTDVAHEFKTPLSLVIGPLNDLIEGKVTEEHKEFCFNIVSRNTNRMMNLVNQLLDFRKVNSGVNILKVSRNDISSFVREVSKSFAWQAKNSGIRFNVIAPDSYFCHFDKDIVEKALYNLLSNAFKYTPNRGIVEIEVKLTWKQELEYLVILIKDSGKGISQLDKKKIFERHFHGKDRFSSGIGLHLVATLIEAHKGTINVFDSSIGGTEFMISLPVSSKVFSEEEFLTKEDIPDNLTYDYSPGEIPHIREEEDDSGKEKVLLVEDDYDLRKYLHNVLIQDYIVFEAVNGNEGLKIALNEIPDIIITDVMMPELDGIEMCREIKKNNLISHIPVLMLTAKTGTEFYNEGLEAGAWDYIAKPFNSSQLRKKIDNIIETRNSFRKHLAKGTTSIIKDHYVSFDQKFVTNAIKIIKEKMPEPSFSVKELSEELGLSRMQLHRKLKSLTGLNTTAFMNSIRMEKAIVMFDGGCDRVQEAMDAIGINSYAHFNTLFKKEKNVTPSKYIEQVKQMKR
ncbi:hybrid sensor histidine kinase/response regulator transcription factor [Tenacibaculum xiamenense]|uniref:hybrid sensor histidine kinase/response regulator transcription factor n=1 Tax=Tenacibaculum xiamenense TaxID=1261553 RepID=UPI003894D5C8